MPGTNVIADLPSGHKQVQRAAFAIADGVQLGIHPALSATDQASTPPFLTPKLVCLIPRFDCVILSLEWKEALWDKFVKGAPRPRTPSELQYSDRKLRSQS
jgi:hypothetical protein